MQSVAAEMNLSETAFLVAEGEGYRLRWFSPTVEVDLCGHATLASAHILWETGRIPALQIAQFYTRSGLLTAVQQGNSIELDFPAEPEKPADPPSVLLKALGVEVLYTGKNRFDYLVEIHSEQALHNLTPDYGRLAEVECRGIIVTCRSEQPEYDFISRFFAPASGINEDPATGSAHCCLGPFWQQRLQRAEMTGYQASKRGGTVRVRMEGDRVKLIGQAVTILHAQLLA
jgi:PhzF family phenazine biosynthesis protein